ncbi:GtrA family protein [Comamonadaceae bacterium G21597-S1]|nr:GtrA family protein [Comamonadaceae bacterium G21597-S1]
MRQFLRYAAIGAVATCVHYAILMLCVEGGHWPAWLASGYGAAIGAQVAYLGNRWFTFAYRANIGLSWLRFQTLALVGALLGMAIVATVVHFGIYYLLAQMLATATVMVLTFMLNKAWTFR